MLHQAQERDLHAIQEQQASLKKRQLSAAATSAELGALKNLQLSYATAATYYRQAAAVVPQEEALTQAEYLNAEGMAWYAAGQYVDAQTPLEHTLSLREKILGPEHSDVATSLNNLAALYYAQGRYADAEPLYQRALAIREKVFGPEHPDVATSLNNLAMLYRAQGRYAEAEPLYQRALAIWEKVLGPEHPDVATSLNNLALLYYTQGRYAEAEPLYPAGAGHPGEGARPRASQRRHEPQQPGRCSTMPRAAMPRPSRSSSGRWPSGRRCSAPSIPTSPRASTTWPLLYDAQGRYADAEPRYQRALAIREKVLGPEHPDVATVGENYAALLRATNRDAEAAQLEARLQAHQPPRAWLGIQMKASTEPPGLFVEKVIAESPAAQAGIQPDDVIIRFNAQEVPDPQTFRRLVEAVAIGTTIDVDIIHDGQRRTIPVTLEQRPLSRP